MSPPQKATLQSEIVMTRPLLEEVILRASRLIDEAG